METEKMIEEMAEDWDYVAHMLRFNDCYMLSLKKWSEPAREMIKLGWIKPNKNLVVLSREEYEKLKQYEEKARKETAREFAEKLKALLEDCSMFENVDIEQLEFDGEAIKEILYETAKQFGVEVE